jgi:hypothetical protein
MEDNDMDAGLDRHLWESEWASIEPLLEDDPGEALSTADDLVERMLAERGFPSDTVAGEGLDPDLAADLEEARRITEAHDAGEDVSAADTIAAARAYKGVYEGLLALGPVGDVAEGQGDVGDGASGAS